MPSVETIYKKLGISKTELEAIRASNKRLDELCFDLDRVQSALSQQADAHLAKTLVSVDLDLVRLERELTSDILALAPFNAPLSEN